MYSPNIAHLTDELWFPKAEEANDSGLLAIGGDLRPERIILAYRNGIFPWFSGKIPMWYNPDPRFILKPVALKISKSMRPIINQHKFEFKINSAFDEVIYNCKVIKRDGQFGTWITKDIVNSYTQLHQMGIVHCAEAWQQHELVGGLYGVRLGNVFFGESMFSKVSNASKFAFIQFVQHLQNDGVELIDCQMKTEHLESLGGEYIPRKLFLKELDRLIKN